MMFAQTNLRTTLIVRHYIGIAVSHRIVMHGIYFPDPPSNLSACNIEKLEWSSLAPGSPGRKLKKENFSLIFARESMA